MLRANKRPDRCFYVLLILNITLLKDKSLHIIGNCLVLNNLVDEYSGSRYSSVVAEQNRVGVGMNIKGLKTS